MESVIYNQQGKEAGTVTLPETVFGVPWNADLVHTVVVSMQANRRTPVAHAKDRGEVSGGGKKPWKQKGTGRARHGSIRSPLWVGGGVTHGPRNTKVFARKVNRKAVARALLAILSRKLRDGEILFVDRLSLSAPKTKEAKGILSALAAIGGYAGVAGKKRNAALLALSGRHTAVVKSFANFSNVKVDEVRNLNPVDLLTYKYLIVEAPESAVKFLEKKAV